MADPEEVLRTSQLTNLPQSGWALHRPLTAEPGDGSGPLDWQTAPPLLLGNVNTMPNSGVREAVSRTITLPSLTRGLGRSLHFSELHTPPMKEPDGQGIASVLTSWDLDWTSLLQQNYKREERGEARRGEGEERGKPTRLQNHSATLPL